MGSTKSSPAQSSATYLFAGDWPSGLSSTGDQLWHWPYTMMNTARNRPVSERDHPRPTALSRRKNGRGTSNQASLQGTNWTQGVCRHNCELSACGTLPKSDAWLTWSHVDLDGYVREHHMRIDSEVLAQVDHAKATADTYCVLNCRLESSVQRLTCKIACNTRTD